MIVHLAIIGGILVIGGILLFPQSQNFLSIDFDFDAAKDDLSSAKDNTINQVGDTLDTTYEKVTNTIDETIDKIG